MWLAMLMASLPALAAYATNASAPLLTEQPLFRTGSSYAGSSTLRLRQLSAGDAAESSTWKRVERRKRPFPRPFDASALHGACEEKVQPISLLL